MWRARQAWPTREIAIKLGGDLGTLRHEAEVLIRVAPPTVPEVIEITQLPGASDDVPALVTEWVEGAAFDLEVSQRPLRERLEWVAAACDAVSRIHTRGFAHGDLKPEHLRIGLGGEVRILDLGSAIDRSACEDRPVDGGSLAYLAPERLTTPGPTRRGDVFSLGVLLYEMITGARPWQSEAAEGPHAYGRAILDGEVPSPRRFRPDLDPALEAVVLRALVRNPGRRTPSAEQLARDLRRFLAGRRVEAHRPGATERMIDYLGRRPRQGLTVAALTILLTAGLVLALTGKQRMRDRTEHAEAMVHAVADAGSILLDRIEAWERQAGTFDRRQHWTELAERIVGNGPLPGEVREVEARLHKILGDLLLEQGLGEGAEDHFVRARNLYRILHARAPSPESGIALSTAWVRIGDAAKLQGDLTTAAHCYLASLRLDERLHRRYPSHVSILDGLGYSHERTGHLAQMLGNVERGRRHLELRLEIAREVHRRESTPHRAFGLLSAHGLLAENAALRGSEGEALEQLFLCYDWGERILRETPNDRKVMLRHTTTLLSFARSIAASGEEPSRPLGLLAHGRAELVDRACRLSRRLRERDPHDWATAAAHITAEIERIRIDERRGRPDGSIDSLRALLAIAREFPDEAGARRAVDQLTGEIELRRIRGWGHSAELPGREHGGVSDRRLHDRSQPDGRPSVEAGLR